MNIFALAFTTYLMRITFGVTGGYYDPNLQGLPNLNLPLISSVPIIGSIFSGHSIIVYLAFIVPLASIFLFRHPTGLHIRAVGENPQAAASLGIHMQRSST